MGKRLKSNDVAFDGFEAEIIDKKCPQWRLRMGQHMKPFRKWVSDQQDYLIVHELVHLHVKHHSEDFWRRVKRVVPD